MIDAEAGKRIFRDDFQRKMVLTLLLSCEEKFGEGYQEAFVRCMKDTYSMTKFEALEVLRGCQDDFLYRQWRRSGDFQLNID